MSMADIFQDVGYNNLSATLGSSLPDGDGFAVLQVEAGVNFVPDANNAEFAGKTFQDLSDTPSAGASGHATFVGQYFYGLTSSMSPAVTDIAILGANPFLFEFLKSGSSSSPEQTARRIANNSWVGDYLSNSNGEVLMLATSNLLRRLEWVIDRDEFIQVVAPDNSISNTRPLLTTVYNVITAGRTDANHLSTVAEVDAIHVTGRPAIHLVVPQSSTSRAAPYVSSAAVLLVEAAHANASWSDGSTSNRAGSVIYNAERSETIKAALMAGASRFTNNTSSTANIDDYRVAAANQTDNGLDWRYGAGQLNINNSYAILAAGEQTSIQEGGSATLSYTGFDYMPRFGGRRGSDAVAEYNLGTASGNQFFTASLVWNLDVDGDSGGFFNSTAVLRNLNLYLVDTTAGANTVVASSLSGIDNTENIFFELIAGHDYQVRVERSGANFEWDYSLAWQATDFVDSDGDGLFDHLDDDFLDPCVPTSFVAACALDSDSDGLTNFQEGEAANTDGDLVLDYLDSNITDTDGDGLVDQLDVANDDPCVPNTFVSVCDTDSDGDGFTDFEEGATTDTDNDGELDYLESNTLDDDGDGVSNQLDAWSDDICLPDESQCSFNVPFISVFGQILLAISLLFLSRRHFRSS